MHILKDVSKETTVKVHQPEARSKVRTNIKVTSNLKEFSVKQGEVQEPLDEASALMPLIEKIGHDKTVRDLTKFQDNSKNQATLITRQGGEILSMERTEMLAENSSDNMGVATVKRIERDTTEIEQQLPLSIVEKLVPEIKETTTARTGIAISKRQVAEKMTKVVGRPKVDTEEIDSCLEISSEKTTPLNITKSEVRDRKNKAERVSKQVGAEEKVEDSLILEQEAVSSTAIVSLTPKSALQQAVLRSTESGEHKKDEELGTFSGDNKVGASAQTGVRSKMETTALQIVEQSTSEESINLSQNPEVVVKAKPSIAPGSINLTKKTETIIVEDLGLDDKTLKNTMQTVANLSLEDKHEMQQSSNQSIELGQDHTEEVQSLQSEQSPRETAVLKKEGKKTNLRPKSIERIEGIDTDVLTTSQINNATASTVQAVTLKEGNKADLAKKSVTSQGVSYSYDQYENLDTKILQKERAKSIDQTFDLLHIEETTSQFDSKKVPRKVVTIGTSKAKVLRDRAKSVDHKLGISLIEESVDELNPGLEVLKTAKVRKQNNPITEQTTSVDKQIGETGSVQIAEENISRIPDTDKICSTSENSRIQKIVVQRETNQGISMDYEKCKDIEPVSMSENTRALTTTGGKKAKNRATSIERSMGALQKQEISDFLEPEVPIHDTAVMEYEQDSKAQARSVEKLVGEERDSEETLDLKVVHLSGHLPAVVKEKHVRETSLYSARSEGLIQELDECEQLKPKTQTKEEKAESKVHKKGYKDRVKSIERQEGFVNVNDKATDLKGQENEVEATEVVETQRKLSIARACEKQLGLTDSLMIPTEFSEKDISNYKSIEPTENMMQPKHRARSIDRKMGHAIVDELTMEMPTGYQAKEFTADISSQALTTELPSKTSVNEGYVQMSETMEEMSPTEEEKGTASIILNKKVSFDQAQLKPHLFGVDVSYDNTENMENEIDKPATAMSKTIGKYQRQSKSVDKQLGIYAEELATQDLSLKTSLKAVTALPSSEIKKLKRVVSNSSKIGFMPKNETTKSNPSEESLTMTAKVGKERPKSIERSINSVAAIGNLTKEEVCEDINETEDISVQIKASKIKSERHRSKSIDRRVGINMEELTVEYFETEPLQPKEVVQISHENNNSDKGTLGSYIQGYQPHQEEIKDFSQDDFETCKASEEKVQSETRKKAKKRDKSLGHYQEEEEAKVFDVNPEKRESLTGKIVGNVFGKVKSIGLGMGIYHTEDSAKETDLVQPNLKQANEGIVKVCLQNPVKKSELIGQNVKKDEINDLKNNLENPLLPKVQLTRGKSSERAKRVCLEQGFEPMEESCDSSEKSILETALATSSETPKQDTNRAFCATKQTGVRYLNTYLNPFKAFCFVKFA